MLTSARKYSVILQWKCTSKQKNLRQVACHFTAITTSAAVAALLPAAVLSSDASHKKETWNVFRIQNEN